MSLLYKPNFIKNIFICLVIMMCGHSHALMAQHVPNKSFTVVIDAGHGGRDPGTLWKNIKEKDIALSIALKFGAYINKYLPDVKVIYTRQTDVFIDLDKRAPIANKNQADLFVSIHVNSSDKNTKPEGTETYMMGSTKLESNLDVAKKENSVIYLEDDYSTKYEGFDPNSSNSFILFSMVQNIHWKQSFTFADQVQKEFATRTSRANRGVKQANFLVLWKTTMPSVLIETGYLSNEEDRKYLTSEKGQDAIALAIYHAFRSYKQDIQNKSIYVNEKRVKDSLSEPHDDTLAENKTVKDTVQTKPVNNIPKNNPEKSSGIDFFVQIIASKKPIVPNSHFFKGMKNVEEVKVGDIYKYVVGRSHSFTKTLDYSKEVKSYFPDAFIIALKDGKIIPIRDARKEIKD